MTENTINDELDLGLFKLSYILEAIKALNFNKGLGPDCFDVNILQANET
jgi:hypothetical protein